MTRCFLEVERKEEKKRKSESDGVGAMDAAMMNSTILCSQEFTAAISPTICRTFSWKIYKIFHRVLSDAFTFVIFVPLSSFAFPSRPRSSSITPILWTIERECHAAFVHFFVVFFVLVRHAHYHTNYTGQRTSAFVTAFFLSPIRIGQQSDRSAGLFRLRNEGSPDKRPLKR